MEQGFPVVAITPQESRVTTMLSGNALFSVIPMEHAQRPHAPAIRPHISAATYPYLFDEPDPEYEFCGLKVVQVPDPQPPTPKFIPFPLTATEVTIGLSAGRCPIPLDAWERQPIRAGLYTPHVFVGCGSGGWYLRSAHGVRRGRKCVTLDGRTVAASSGNQVLHDGSDLQLGGFRFQVRLSPVNCVELTGDCSGREIIAEVENRLHAVVASTLRKHFGENWWDKVPQPIQEGCEERKKDDASAEHPYRFVFLRELQGIILAYWQLFATPPFNSVWQSRTQMRGVFNSIISIRNKLMHPTRVPPADTELGFLLLVRNRFRKSAATTAART